MLVLTRKIQEAVVINDRVLVVPTNLSEMEATVSVSALEPFNACRGEELGETERVLAGRTHYAFVLKPNDCIVIDDEITVVFIVARTPDGETEPKARFGFESPNRTKLQRRDALGSIVKEYEFGPEPSKQLPAR